MGTERSPARIKREKRSRAAEERRWAARSGPVRTIVAPKQGDLHPRDHQRLQKAREPTRHRTNGTPPPPNGTHPPNPGTTPPQKATTPPNPAHPTTANYT